MRKAIYFIYFLVIALRAQEGYADASGPMDEPLEALQETPIAIVQPPEEVKPLVQEPAKGPFAAFTGKVIKSKVRLRLQPSLDSAIVRELDNGELLAIIGETEDFFVVQPPTDIKAYIYRTYVLDGVVEGNHVNVRIAPDLSAAIIAQMNSGDPVSGAVSTIDKRWLEIAPPANTRFFIMKEYIQKVGDIHYITSLKKRQVEAEGLYNSAKIASQVELQKPFDQINLDKANQNLGKLIALYKDFPEEVKRAQELQNSIQTAYLKKQVAHMEVMAKSSSQKQESVITQPEPVAQTSSPVASNVLSSAMAAWMPVEQFLYEKWASMHGNAAIEEFYRQQAESSITVRGILEPFARNVKNRPGDYVLLSETQRQPIAYLYSTKVNLQDKAGMPIEVEVLPRDNHNFAYPAYFVLSVH